MRVQLLSVAALGFCACSSTAQTNMDDMQGAGGARVDPFTDDEAMQLPNGPLEDDELTDALEGHNEIREELNLPPLEWVPSLANIAATWAAGCVDEDGDDQIDHNVDLNELELGENIWAGTKSRAATAAVDSWAAEVDDYDYDSNSCNGPACGHYTQIVWRDTDQVGCARAFCEDLEYRYVILCNYRPPGNVDGASPY